MSAIHTPRDQTCRWTRAGSRLHPAQFTEPTARWLCHRLSSLPSPCVIAPTGHLSDLGQSAAPSAHFAAVLLMPVSAHVASVSGQAYQRVACFAWEHWDWNPSALPV